jgi:hypothetical protein
VILFLPTKGLYVEGIKKSLKVVSVVVAGPSVMALVHSLFQTLVIQKK